MPGAIAAARSCLPETGDPTPDLRQLRVRSEFVRAQRGRRRKAKAFTLIMAQRPLCDTPGIGYTVTKKVGNAPERNRIKRRLRAAVRENRSFFVAGRDYVLIGRREALHEPFGTLVATLRSALTETARPDRPGPGMAAKT